jgi:hypothetical protein
MRTNNASIFQSHAYPHPSHIFHAVDSPTGSNVVNICVALSNMCNNKVQCKRLSISHFVIANRAIVNRLHTITIIKCLKNCKTKNLNELGHFIILDRISMIGLVSHKAAIHNYKLAKCALKFLQSWLTIPMMTL